MVSAPSREAAEGAGVDTKTTVVFVAVVGGRFLLPLLIPFFPLPGILASLVLDGVDQSIFQAFGHDPPQYQGYDKAMDVYYLAVAYLSTMRNWTSRPAVQVGRFLYFYRLIGVVAFELSGWRPLLLIFPNTFEYFFIAYEIVRLRWNPARYGTKYWVIVAALIWVVVKLPQEWWIHIAKLDVTDTMAAHHWVLPTLIAVLLVAFVVFWFAIRTRLPEPDHPWRVAADPLPAGVDSAAERDRWVAAHRRLWSTATLELVVLLSLLWAIFASVLPGNTANSPQEIAAVAVFVVVNAAISLAVARRTRSRESALAAFITRAVLNVGLVLLASLLIPGGLDRANAIFFALLLSLISLLDDRFRPVYEARFAKVGVSA
ncbi:MAG TPA: hypothetical protein VGJ28_05460 [Micromonosporaceae bacterium]